MDATENKELREQLEQKQKELEQIIKENSSLRSALHKMQGEIRQLAHVMEARERVAELMNIVALDLKLPTREKFNSQFILQVKAEIMYLTNGSDPYHFYTKENKFDEVGSDPDGEEGKQGEIPQEPGGPDNA